jgi:hypothetical protein
MWTALRLIGGMMLVMLGFLFFAMSFGPCGGGYITLALAGVCWFFGGRKLFRTLVWALSGGTGANPSATQQTK